MYKGGIQPNPLKLIQSYKGFPTSTPSPGNPFFPHEKAVVCTGFAVCSGFHVILRQRSYPRERVLKRFRLARQITTTLA